MIAAAILIITIAVSYPKARMRSKEFHLHNNLFTLRTVIDEYTFDKKKRPQSLQDLVDAGYLRAVPVDPITGKDQWIVIQQDAPGIWDVHSASDRKSLEGTQYADW